MNRLSRVLRLRCHSAAWLLPLVSVCPFTSQAQVSPAAEQTAQAQKPRPSTRPATLSQQVKQLQNQVDEQARELQALRERLDTQVAQHQDLQQEVQAQRTAVATSTPAAAGTGIVPAGAMSRSVWHLHSQNHHCR